MALIIKDRVQETSSTTGTGTLTLAGAVTGYQTFSSAIGNGNTTYYTIYVPGGSDWEVGLGTVGAGTLARTTVLASSNSGSLVNFSATTLNVFCDYPAGKAVYQDGNGNVFANNFIPNTTFTTASSTPVNLTVASAQYQVVTGSVTSQTFNLPDATTLSVGDTFYFNNNITYSSVQINAHDGTTSLLALQAGGAAHLILLTNSTTNGTWDVHSYVPSSVSWGNATLNFNSASSISGSVTWQGNVVTGTYGGTGVNNGSNTLTLSGSYTLNQSVASGAAPTFTGTNFSGIPNGALTNSAITINGTSTSLGGSINVGTVTSVTGTAPVVSSGGSTPAISMAAATSSANGYLTSTDWNTFNNKQPAGTYVTTVSATSPVTSTGGTTPTIAMPAATSSVNGYLTSTDWSTFNGKQALLVSGTNIKTINTNSILGSGDLTITASAAGSNTQVQYNNSGAFAGSSSFTYNSSTGALTAPEVIASNALIINSTTVSTSYTVASGNNAFTVGPVTVNSGVTVTVSSGQRWIVI